jgi:asparagine N-glycosylation enzyme membrane subunit Stt3
MSKPLLAFCLGLLGIFLSFVGAEAGLLAAFILIGAYFLTCQFLLSRGNVNAYRKDWPIMLAMVATFLVMIVIMALVEKQEVVLSQGLGFLLSCCGGTYAGAVAASLIARRKAVQR